MPACAERLAISVAAATVFALTSRPTHAHAAGVQDGSTIWSAAILLATLIAGAVYLRGFVRLRARSRSRVSMPAARGVLFAAGLAVVPLCLLSPLDGLAEIRLSAHMVEHELLMIVAAPLLVLARPIPALLWALGPGSRAQVAGWNRAPGLRAGWRFFATPFIAWLLHGIVLWGWHAPGAFEAALHDPGLHLFQHVTFFTTALLFWWAAMEASPASGAGAASVLYLFTFMLHTGLLGVLMTFARAPWYPSYAVVADAGLTPLQDQQLAGLVMWIPAGLVYTAAALAQVARWLRRNELQAQRREQLAGLRP